MGLTIIIAVFSALFGFLIGWVLCGLICFENWDITYKIQQEKKRVKND